MERLNLEYYYGKEAEQFTFYRLPKALITDMELIKQHIKNDLFGSETEAVEIYPEERNRIDTEGLYHLWIPQESAKLPFGMDRRKLRAVDRGYKRDPVGFLIELAEIFGISLEGGD